MKPVNTYLKSTKSSVLHILIVEDDKSVGSMLLEMLSNQYICEHVTDIASFRNRFNSFRPDIVLLDLNLPDGSGLDLCREIRKGAIHNDAVIIVMTGDSGEKTVNSAYKAGATDYIRKPFFPTELLAKIKILSENVLSKQNLKQLYDELKLFNKKLYKLTSIINSNINELTKTDIITSIEDVINILDCPYCEIVLFSQQANNPFQINRSPRINFLSFKKLVKLKPLIKDSQENLITFKVKEPNYTVYVYIYKILFNSRKSGVVSLQSTHPLPQQTVDMMALYLDFINLKGADIDIKNRLQNEIDKERKEIHKVRSIQVSLLPDFKEIPGYSIASTFIPMDEISGDFFDAFYISKGVYQIVVCDVCGHGMASSYIGSAIRSIIRSISSQLAEPARITDTLNRVLIQTSRDIYYFATMFLWQIDFTSNSITYVSTGHPTAFFYKSKSKKIIELGQTGPLIGLFDDAIFEQKTIAFDTDDTLIVYTDGLIEAPSPIKKELYGTDRLKKQFEHAIKHTKPIDILHSVLGSVYSFMDYSAVDDDVTVICMKKSDADTNGDDDSEKL
ncbi:MAG TPA: SpoIIE family protein phosphatase [Spirochaetota bacterium]|nr:SpoIIE family protein phosphatase [Spirochaetota bacterium]